MSVALGQVSGSVETLHSPCAEPSRWAPVRIRGTARVFLRISMYMNGNRCKDRCLQDRSVSANRRPGRGTQRKEAPMRLRRALAIGGALLVTVGGLLVGPAPAQAATEVTLASTIRLSNCSASLVRYPNSASTD